jgi:hypothetical protein
VSGGTTSVTITGLHPGWYIDFTIFAKSSNGTVYTSDPVTAFMTGLYTEPWQGTLWGGISVSQTDPFAQ